jgi:hypothetical protein
VDGAVKDHTTTDEALHLDLAQAAMVHKSDVVIVGTYGVGKTSVIESIGERTYMQNSSANLTVIIWEKSDKLVERFQARFPAADVMDGEAACQKFGVTMDKEEPTSSLSEICAAMTAAHPGAPLHLLVDEFPCRGDLSKLQTHGVITALAVQPATSSPSSTAPVVAAPAGMELLELLRQYRYNLATGAFLARVVKGWEAASSSRHLSTVPGREVPGHQLCGDLPECVILPECSCSTYCCMDPAQHLLRDQWAALQALLARLVREGVAHRLTIIVDTWNKAAECQQWLQTELAGRPELSGLQVVTVDQFRGLEAEILLWIGDGDFSTMLDSCSRVTGRLLLVPLAVTGDDTYNMQSALTAACREGRARWAPEQQMVGGPPAPS